VIRTIGLLLPLLWSGPQEDVTRALDHGDYRLAWERAEAREDPVERARARSQVLYRAGDPAGALGAAREGLALDPEDLELLHRAAGAAVWLEASDLARELADRLARAVDGAGLADEHRPAWEAAVLDYREAARRLADREGARRAATRRARATAGGTLLTLVGLVVAVAFVGRPPRNP
jgi:tetratricopeptide (TPR) repeat protein